MASQQLLNDYIVKLNEIFIRHNVCQSHGIDHAICVLNNAIEALQYINISDNDKKLVCIAALLHDADDYKFFPNNKLEYQNLKTIMTYCKHDDKDINIVLRMVDLVSSSKNGDNIPSDVPEWYVIPRYADRLEAIGLIGIKRCYQYNKTINAKIFDENTPVFASKEDIIKYVNNNKKRYTSYNGTSNSMIDHYYDKLLHITEFPIRNKYFDKCCEELLDIQLNFLLFFGSCINHNNKFTYCDVETFINKYTISS
jgi:uncharacterized protein